MSGAERKLTPRKLSHSAVEGASKLEPLDQELALPSPPKKSLSDAVDAYVKEQQESTSSEGVALSPLKTEDSTVGDLLDSIPKVRRQSSGRRKNSLVGLQAFLDAAKAKQEEVQSVLDAGGTKEGGGNAQAKEVESTSPDNSSSRKSRFGKRKKEPYPKYVEEGDISTSVRMDRQRIALRFETLGFPVDATKSALRQCRDDTREAALRLLKWFPKGSAISKMIIKCAEIIVSAEKKLKDGLKAVQKTMKQGTVQERLVGVRRYFDEIDADNKEFLTPEEFQKLAFSLGIELSESELQEAILKIDEDGNGQIEVDEFLGWWGEDDLIEEYERQEALRGKGDDADADDGGGGGGEKEGDGEKGAPTKAGKKSSSNIDSWYKHSTHLKSSLSAADDSPLPPLKEPAFARRHTYDTNGRDDSRQKPKVTADEYMIKIYDSLQRTVNRHKVSSRILSNISDYETRTSFKLSAKTAPVGFKSVGAAGRNAIRHGNPIGGVAGESGSGKSRVIDNGGKRKQEDSKPEGVATKQPSWKERRHTFDPDKTPTQIRRRMSRKNSWEFMPKIKASRTPGIQSFKVPQSNARRSRFLSGDVDKYSLIAAKNGSPLMEQLHREPHTRSEGQLSLTLASAGAGAIGGQSVPAPTFSSIGFGFRAGSQKGKGRGGGSSERSPSQAW